MIFFHCTVHGKKVDRRRLHSFCDNDNSFFLNSTVTSSLLVFTTLELSASTPLQEVSPCCCSLHTVCVLQRWILVFFSGSSIYHTQNGFRAWFLCRFLLEKKYRRCTSSDPKAILQCICSKNWGSLQNWLDSTANYKICYLQMVMS